MGGGGGGGGGGVGVKLVSCTVFHSKKPILFVNIQKSNLAIKETPSI